MMIKKYNSFITESVGLKVTDQMTRSWLSDPSFKKDNIRNFGEILKSVYQPIGNWKKKSESGFFGVMDLDWDNERWSILNRINTNYTALSIIINSVNRAVSNSKSITKFDFINNAFGTNDFKSEYNRFIEFLKKNSKMFLKTTEEDGSITINEVVSAIRTTKSIGDLGEKIVVDYLPKLNSGITDIKIPEGSGDSTDMVGGADVLFNYKDKTYTIQVKKVRSVSFINSKYLTSGASISKHYKTNYYAILDRTNLYFFKNDESLIELKDGELSIDSSLLVKNFTY